MPTIDETIAELEGSIREKLGAMYSHRGDGIPTQFVNPDGPATIEKIDALITAYRDMKKRNSATDVGLREAALALLAGLDSLDSDWMNALRTVEIETIRPLLDGLRNAGSDPWDHALECADAVIAVLPDIARLEDAVDEAEISLSYMCDLMWNGKAPTDARDMSRTVYGAFKAMRETLKLPEKAVRYETDERGIYRKQAADRERFDNLVHQLRGDWISHIECKTFDEVLAGIEDPSNYLDNDGSDPCGA